MSERVEHRESSTTDSPSEAVVRAVAKHKGIDPVAVEQPLYDAVDPDALDALIAGSAPPAGGSATTVSFAYAGHEVHLSDGCVVTVASDNEM